MVLKVKQLAASLEAAGLEGWWDTLVTAIVGVEDLDDYKGKRSPWSSDYKNLMRKTFANPTWVSKQVLVDGMVSAGGIASRLNGFSDSKGYFEDIQRSIANVTSYVPDYIKVVQAYSDAIRKLHKDLSAACKDGVDAKAVKATLAAMRALEHPGAYVLKHAKPTVDGSVIKATNQRKGWLTSKPKGILPEEIPALTEKQFAEAVKLIVSISNDTHPLRVLEEKLNDVMRFCDFKDGDPFWEKLQALDEDLYLEYCDETYDQSHWDDLEVPGLWAYEILAALVIWAARSTGKTGASLSLESFQSNDKVDLSVIARTAHEAVRSLAQSFGDNSHLSWEDSPEWVRDSAINGAALHVMNPELTAEQTHEAWLKAKQEEGWACGPTKDADRKEHPCMVPYAELSQEHRLKDHLFKSIVDAFMACLREDNPSVQVTGLECACGSLEQRYDGVLNNRMPVGVALESAGLIGRIMDWFKGEEEQLPADLDEALRKTKGIIKKSWLDQQEFSTSAITDEKLVASLTYGDKPLTGGDHRIVVSSSGDLYDWLDHAEGHWDDALADIKPLIEAGLKAKKMDTKAIRAAFIAKLPHIKAKLPEGKLFECDGEFFGIRDFDIGKSVPAIAAADVLKMQDAFRDAMSCAADGLSDLKHHYLMNDLFAEEFKEVAQVEDSDDNWIGDSLSMDWYYKPILQALTIVASNNSALVGWVKASVKAKK